MIEFGVLPADTGRAGSGAHYWKALRCYPFLFTQTCVLDRFTFMIIGTVRPTAPLSKERAAESAERAISATLPPATNPREPVVLLCGCDRPSLSLKTGEGALWSVSPYNISDPYRASPKASISDSRPRSVSDPGKLSTGFSISSDYMGLFKVQAAVPGRTTYEWFVRFIDLQITGHKETTDTKPKMNLHDEKDGYVAICAHFNCAVDIRLRGSDDQPGCYDFIKCGILQNMDWIEGETCYGVYSGLGSRLTKGHLFEPVPRAPSPNVDCGQEDLFPFYESQENPKIGAFRHLTFWDGPGILVPIFYDLNTNEGLTPENVKYLIDKSAAFKYSRHVFVLREVAGQVSFRSAISAKSSYAPNSYVVRGVIHWDFVLNQRINEILMTEYSNGTVNGESINKYLANSAQPNGTQLNAKPFQMFSAPLDACEAGLETFGPKSTATKTTKVCRWEKHERRLK
jgi:hypothetical protein